MKHRFWALVIVAALVLVGVASADTCTATLGPNGECVSESVNGSIVTVTVDTTNLTITANFLDAVAIGLGDANQSATLTSVTRDGVNVTANWSNVPGGLSNGVSGAGCDGTGNFDCAQASDPDGSFSAVGKVFVFTFQLAQGSTANFTFKDIFVNSDDTKVGTIMSQTVTGPGGPPVPEPGTLVLLGTGLLSAGVFLRRRMGL